MWGQKNLGPYSGKFVTVPTDWNFLTVVLTVDVGIFRQPPPSLFTHKEQAPQPPGPADEVREAERVTQPHTEHQNYLRSH